jgi:Crp-like helix-turn-helix domain
VPPLLSIAPAASSASRLLSDPSRSEAEKTRKETGSRAWPSTVVISPEGGVVGPYSRRGVVGRKRSKPSAARYTSSACAESCCSSRNYGRVALDGMRIDFPLSHTLLADMVGSSRETVTRY